MLTTKSDAVNFAKRLKSLRRQKGFSQTELAEKIGVKRRTICYYECESKRPPSLSLLKKIAEVLEVSLETLIGTEPIKTDHRTIDAKFWKKWERLENNDKKAVTKIVEVILTKQHIS